MCQAGTTPLEINGPSSQRWGLLVVMCGVDTYIYIGVRGYYVLQDAGKYKEMRKGWIWSDNEKKQRKTSDVETKVSQISTPNLSCPANVCLHNRTACVHIHVSPSFVNALSSNALRPYFDSSDSLQFTSIYMGWYKSNYIKTKPELEKKIYKPRFMYTTKDSFGTAINRSSHKEHNSYFSSNQMILSFIRVI
jgi:hypothetical protein